MSERGLSGGGEVFEDISRKYDRLNRVLSLGRDQAWRRRAIAYLPPGRFATIERSNAFPFPESMKR